jgi:hypothetical protein
MRSFIFRMEMIRDILRKWLTAYKWASKTGTQKERKGQVRKKSLENKFNKSWIFKDKICEWMD